MVWISLKQDETCSILNFPKVIPAWALSLRNHAPPDPCGWIHHSLHYFRTNVRDGSIQFLVFLSHIIRDIRRPSMEFYDPSALGRNEELDAVSLSTPDEMDRAVRKRPASLNRGIVLSSISRLAT
jgi:hypothetical protein